MGPRENDVNRREAYVPAGAVDGARSAPPGETYVSAGGGGSSPTPTPAPAPTPTPAPTSTRTPRESPRRDRPRTAEEIRREIDRTRAEMDQTVDELQHRLSPHHLADQAKANIKETTRQTKDNVVSVLRDHPIPAAVAGVGLGWLIAAAIRDRQSNGFRGTRGAPSTYFDAEVRRRSSLEQAGLASYGPSSHPNPEIGVYEREAIPQSGMSGTSRPSSAERAKSRSRDIAQQAKYRAEHLKGKAGERVGDFKDRVRERADDFKDRARERAHDFTDSARERASSMGHRMSDMASSAAHSAQRGLSHTRKSAVETMHEHPLAIALAVLGAGIAAGLAIPITRKEDEWMGSARDDLFEQAKERGEDYLHRGEAVAEAAYHGAKEEAQEEAQRQGIASGSSSSAGSSGSSGGSQSSSSSSSGSPGSSSAGGTQPSSSSGSSTSGSSSSGSSSSKEGRDKPEGGTSPSGASSSSSSGGGSSSSSSPGKS